MKIWTWTALAWAALISAAGHEEPGAAWLASGTIAFAPLARAILVSQAKASPGRMPAAEAEALAWSQPAPPAQRPPTSRAVRTGPIRLGAQPLSA